MGGVVAKLFEGCTPSLSDVGWGCRLCGRPKPSEKLLTPRDVGRTQSLKLIGVEKTNISSLSLFSLILTERFVKYLVDCPAPVIKRATKRSNYSLCSCSGIQQHVFFPANGAATHPRVGTKGMFYKGSRDSLL